MAQPFQLGGLWSSRKALVDQQLWIAVGLSEVTADSISGRTFGLTSNNARMRLAISKHLKARSLFSPIIQAEMTPRMTHDLCDVFQFENTFAF